MAPGSSQDAGAYDLVLARQRDGMEENGRAPEKVSEIDRGDK